MDFNSLMTHRYSVRKYKPDDVPDGTLRSVLEAARLAPTAANRQSFQALVIHTRGREKDLRRIYDRQWFVEAPVVICVCSIPEGNWVRGDGRNYSDVDTAIVMDHMILAATELGLGTCWIGAFNAAAAREILRLPDNVDPVVFTPLGYAADVPQSKQRKDLVELIRYETW